MNSTSIQGLDASEGTQCPHHVTHWAFCGDRLLHFTPPISTKEAQCLASLLFNVKNNIYHTEAHYSKPFVESLPRLLVLNLDQKERRLSKKFRL